MATCHLVDLTLELDNSECRTDDVVSSGSSATLSQQSQPIEKDYLPTRPRDIDLILRHHHVDQDHTSPLPLAKRQRTTPKQVSGVGSRSSPIDLLDDDIDNDLEHAIFAAYPILSRPKTASSLRDLQQQLGTVDLTEDETQETGQVLYDNHRHTMLTHSISIIDLVDDHPEFKTPDQIIIRNPIKLGHVTCAVGKTVEFTNGIFMRIQSMSRDNRSSGTLTLSGKCFVRQNSYGAKVPKRRNDVVYVGDTCKTVHQHEIVRNRNLIMTNFLYPQVSARNHPDSWSDGNQDVILGPLFCRWKRSRKCEGARLVEESWQSLSADEADPAFRVSDGAKRWRYCKLATFPGGSHNQTYLTWDDAGKEVEGHINQYTFGDAFCGAGGTSCGARMAGLKLEWSFDKDFEAVNTYQLNFPESTCYHLAVDEFITRTKKSDKRYRVDVLHISPPCQPFSPAHTVPSLIRDELNSAALFSVGELVESVKPRIVTIEETEGLVSRHGEWFAALIHIFIRIGYSVMWKIIKCGDYGIPQPNRKRLMLIAAGPGEVLPEFPMPTHAVIPTATLKKIPTIGERICNLDGAPNHDTSILRKVPQPPFNPNSYAHTLTCNSGVGNYHPSGRRNYTVRELACLQTFPRSFKFANVSMTSQKRQIGNAVPPELSKAVMGAIIKSLRRTDGIAPHL